ncbi:hypothetical protein QOT17_017993 [Balamuthia mandrillaris]
MRSTGAALFPLVVASLLVGGLLATTQAQPPHPNVDLHFVAQLSFGPNYTTPTDAETAYYSVKSIKDQVFNAREDYNMKDPQTGEVYGVHFLARSDLGKVYLVITFPNNTTKCQVAPFSIYSVLNQPGFRVTVFTSGLNSDSSIIYKGQRTVAGHLCDWWGSATDSQFAYYTYQLQSPSSASASTIPVKLEDGRFMDAEFVSFKPGPLPPSVFDVPKDEAGCKSVSSLAFPL